MGRALADPTRCRILVALLDGVNYPGQLAAHLGLSRSNVSNHLSCLRGCGLVVATYQGRQVRYALADPHLARALGELVHVVLAVDAAEECVDGQRWMRHEPRVGGSPREAWRGESCCATPPAALLTTTGRGSDEDHRHADSCGTDETGI